MQGSQKRPRNAGKALCETAWRNALSPLQGWSGFNAPFPGLRSLREALLWAILLRSLRELVCEAAKKFAFRRIGYAPPLCNTSFMSLVKELLRPLAEDGASLTREQAAEVLEEILAGGVPEVETAALLAVLATRGEQAPELAGFVDVMRKHSVPLPFSETERAELVDCVGTGGGGPQTFNISCGAALVASAAGARVAKHGNRAVTSLCGAADVLEALGVPVELTPELAVECLRETGFVFLYAPLYHPAMKALGPLRKALGFRTILNLVGPLTNPARARTQVIGVLAPSRVLLVGRTLAMLGARRAFVVHGTDGIDELTTTGESVVARIEENEKGEPQLKAARVTPEMAGLPRATIDQFTGGEVATNKALLYDVLTGIKGARRDVVLLNAAAVLVAAGLVGDLKEGVAMGAEAIDTGQAAATLAKLQQFAAKHAMKE
jgi:anthranilate phosphoribosyltransferase